MRKIFFFLFICLVFSTKKNFGQGNSTCANASPFCTTGQYPAGTNQPNPTPAIGCLGSQPNPAWFSIPIAQSGTLSITMQGGVTPSGFNADIDFITWGPFTSATGNCNNLTAATQVQNVNGNNGCSYSGSSTENLIITNAQAGEYYILLITNFSGQPNQITITQNAVAGSAVTGGTLDITVTNNGPVCEGQPINFSVAGANSYTWTGPAAFINPNADPQSIPISQLSNTGTYTVNGAFTVAGSPKTCTGVATTYVLVKPNPTITVSKGGDFCVGRSGNLVANGAYTYTWSGPNGYSFQGATPVFASNSLSMAGTYYVTGAMNGCKTTTDIAVSINPLPLVTAASKSVCEGDSFSFIASGAQTYTWTGPVWNSTNYFSSYQSTIDINAAQGYMAGYYFLTGKDANGCVNYDTLFQIVRPLPIVVVSDGAACAGQPLYLSAAGGANYQWSGPLGYSSNMQSPVIANADPSNSGEYNVVVSSVYGCSQTAVAIGTVYATPNIQVQGNMEVCEGQIFTFKGAGGNEYRWLASFGEVVKGPTFTISSVSPQLQTSYTLVGLDDHACTNTTLFYPIVNRLPQARINTNSIGACVPFCTTLNLEKLSPNIKTVSWKFSDGVNVPANAVKYEKCMKKAGVYTYTINMVDSAGCINSTKGKLEAYPSPEADFEYTPVKPNVNNNLVTFYDKSEGEIKEWKWDFYNDAVGNKKDTSNIRYLQNPTRRYKDAGMYFIYFTVTSANGCKDSTAKFITIEEDPTFFIPDTFTPNGDGLNDVFIPKGIALMQYEMKIFNRWGKMIFATNDPNQGWDGKISEEEYYPNDDYIYKFTVTDANLITKEYVGRVTLLK